MSLRKSHALGGAGLVAACAVALALWRCGGSSEPPAREPRAEADSNEEERSAAAEPAATAPPAALVDVTADAAPGDARRAPNGDAAPTASGGSAPSSSAASRVNAALERDPKDLALFSRVERELKRAPPPSVNQIVELRARGASRDELMAEARRLFADDFQLRALVVRWLDEVAPPPGGASKPVPSAPGSGKPVVQPIRKK